MKSKQRDYNFIKKDQWEKKIKVGTQKVPQTQMECILSEQQCMVGEAKKTRCRHAWKGASSRHNTPKAGLRSTINTTPHHTTSSQTQLPPPSMLSDGVKTETALVINNTIVHKAHLAITKILSDRQEQWKNLDC